MLGCTDIESTDIESTDIESTDIESTDIESTDIESTDIEMYKMYTDSDLADWDSEGVLSFGELGIGGVEEVRTGGGEGRD
ncbi:predicted protein [Sclerotinia sclerotiorum 1980 UF-70]|uniref:Uncharacterized protein n=2 Tax=Sclerotinia sclerotiorum (strain ATCC 18683 / 1980 / Ss-1) TaxID=665079 RepID=A7F235_SCLS1|nr:predicted protein [Sclerotinia sclerotiorum 1980 UF-70]APA11397.1 hypothetical protein sscle_07g061670 [Sclerotinia sclerotiorum 1980 UF-70]EDN95777.1 predicted protein [Sclerotinia sclerotiorum 1980 UF-70]